MIGLSENYAHNYNCLFLNLNELDTISIKLEKRKVLTF